MCRTVSLWMASDRRYSDFGSHRSAGHVFDELRRKLQIFTRSSARLLSPERISSSRWTVTLPAAQQRYAQAHTPEPQEQTSVSRHCPRSRPSRLPRPTGQHAGHLHTRVRPPTPRPTRPEPLSPDTATACNGSGRVGCSPDHRPGPSCRRRSAICVGRPAVEPAAVAKQSRRDAVLPINQRAVAPGAGRSWTTACWLSRAASDRRNIKFAGGHEPSRCSGNAWATRAHS